MGLIWVVHWKCLQGIAFQFGPSMDFMVYLVKPFLWARKSLEILNLKKTLGLVYENRRRDIVFIEHFFFTHF